MSVRPDQRSDGSHRTRVGKLRAEYQRLRHRYGVLEIRPDLARIERATNRREYRAKHLREQIEELQSELSWLESELENFDKGKELLLAKAIDELRSKFREAWSPLPMLGFRYWMIRDAHFVGFRQPWTEPGKDAVCLSTRIDDEVPHTDGRCGPPPCGIYAAKDAQALLDTMLNEQGPGRSLAVGLVGLSGKVVEHCRGYRAARADVLALAIIPAGQEPAFAHQPDDLTELFGQSGSVIRRLAAAAIRPHPQTDDPARIKTLVINYLQEQERLHTWTLENKNG